MLYFKLSLEILEHNILSHQIRGYIGNKFREEILLHHHIDKNKLLYRYPLVQYKQVDNMYYIIGLNEGAYVLKKLWDKIDILEINGKHIQIMEKQIEYKEIKIKESDELLKYKFMTPWIALNQKNYREFKLMLNNERKEKLKKILINNVISFCKSIGYTIKETLKTDVNLQTMRVILKNIKMVGFIGSFRINFLLPDYIGLGKSISRGFGSIKR